MLRVIYWRNSILRNKLKKCTYNKQQFSFYRPFQIPEGLWSLLDSPELFHCLWVSGQRSVYWLLSYFLCYRLIWPQTYESRNQTYIQLNFFYIRILHNVHWNCITWLKKTYIDWLTCLLFIHHVIDAIGLDPIASHWILYDFPTDIGFRSYLIRTAEGPTRI